MHLWKDLSLTFVLVLVEDSTNPSGTDNPRLPTLFEPPEIKNLENSGGLLDRKILGFIAG